MKEVWKLIVEQKFSKSKCGNEILVIDENILCSQVLFMQQQYVCGRSNTDSAGISTTYLQQQYGMGKVIQIP
jgi:hypothetical protein